MKSLEEYTSAAYHDFLDYAVVDQAGEQIGTLFSSWSDEKTGAFEFLGVKTGWLVGKNHIIPAKGAMVDDEGHKIHLPYSSKTLKNAPTCDAAAEITEAHEDEIRGYYEGKT